MFALVLDLTTVWVCFIFNFLGVRTKLNPLGTSATIWPIVPAPDVEFEAVGGIRIGRGNPKYSEKTCQQ
jgi:hypothetical protein